MACPDITILGLGPGDAQLLTRRAWQVLERTPELYLRTRMHPVIAGLPAGLQVYSFDDLYEKGDSFEAVYAGIVAKVLELGKRPQGVVYGVPGHPFVAEATTPEIVRRGSEMGLKVEVVEGLSFLEPVFTALGIDPLPQMAIVDALGLGEALLPAFPADAPLIVAQIHSRQVASDVKLTLMETYPDEHPVKMVHAAGTPQVCVETLPLYEIDRSNHVGLMTTLYLPPLAVGNSFEAFQEVIARLRAPDGCPWDREQTHQSLRPYLLEETYEVLTALDADEPVALREELGDLLLQIVLHTQIASENGEFRMVDVLRNIYQKIVYRHPHVFGQVKLSDAASVVQNWERLKADEKNAKGEAKKSVLDGVALALPACSQAQEYQKRAGRVGFDWSDIQGVVDKVEEELREARSAIEDTARASEIGDLLFAVVNLARWWHVDAESTLREANLRFRRRFSHIEEAARKEGRQLSDLSLDEMEKHWQAAKQLE